MAWKCLATKELQEKGVVNKAEDVLRLMRERSSSRSLSDGKVQQVAWKPAVMLVVNFMKLE